MNTKRRAYSKLRDIIEQRGGRMTWQRQGYRYGAWEISLDGKTAIIEAIGVKSFPALDRLYIPDVASPTTWDDYRDELVSDAENQLLALLGMPTPLNICWAGPYPLLPRGSRNVGEMKAWNASGVYIIGIPTETGFLPYWAGYTQQKFSARLFVHPKEFLTGSYAILDVNKMTKGKKKVVWRGGYYWSGAEPEHWRSLSRFVEDLPALAPQLQALLQSLQVLLGAMTCDRRLMQRVEASVMHALFKSPRNQRAFYSTDMALHPRHKEEPPIPICCRFPCAVRGLPASLTA